MAVKGKKGKISVRERTKYRIRKKVTGRDDRPRLTVFRSSKHTYAQVVSDQSGKTLASASTFEKDVLAEVSVIEKGLTTGKKGEDSQKSASLSKSTKGVIAAMAVGSVLAKRCLAKDIKQVVFDRNGYIYHGRVKGVADGARKGGLGL